METRAASTDAARIERDLRLEGEPEREFNPGIAERLPRKNVAAGALIRDEHARILFVVPTYKPFLDIPGGLAEDNESPRAAGDREICEELGISLGLGASRFLSLDDALAQLRPSMARRMTLAMTALDEGQTIYAEFGHRR